ncbi:MAG: tail fiber domain-containing protein [Candidatus Woesearchaeota archaeon]|nr:tail fiber domain-containing protein [Candidatus Woesearchaeota archaeon]
MRAFLLVLVLLSMQFVVAAPSHIVTSGDVNSTGGDICIVGGNCLSTAAQGSEAGGWTDDGSTVRLTTSTDSVGIGTTSPDEILTIGDGTTTGNKAIHIEDHDDVYIFLEADEDDSGEDDNPYIKFSQDNAAVQSIVGMVGAAGTDPEAVAYTDTLVNSFLLGTTNGYPLQLGTADVVEMTIESGGDIGVGTANPEVPFDINTTSNADGLRIRGTSSTTEITDLYTGSSGHFIIDMTAGADTSQFIDFRTESSQHGLIVRESDGTGTATFANIYVTDTTDDYLSINLNEAADGDAFVVTAANEVGIGTSDPDGKLQVTGNEVRIGDAGTLNTAAGDGDLFVEDALEVDGVLDIDGTGTNEFAGSLDAPSYTGLDDSYALVAGDTHVYLDLDNDDDGSANLYVRDGGNNVVFQVDESGNVQADGTLAIGTTTASEDLTIGDGTTTGNKAIHIEDHDDVYIFLEADEDGTGGEDDNPYIKFSQDNTGVQSILGHVGNSGVDPEAVTYTSALGNALLMGTTTTNSALQLGTGDVVALTIDTSQNIGIGNNAPDTNHKLDVTGHILAENGASTGATRNAGLRLYTDDAFGTELHYSDGSWSTAVFGRTTDENALQFGAYAGSATDQGAMTHYMTIENDGDVGIGTEDPAHLLHLADAIPDIQYDDTTGDDWVVGNNNGEFRFYNENDAETYLEIEQNGEVGIGTTSSDAKLDIAWDGTAAATEVGLELDLTVANADIMLLLNSSDGGIGSGSDFIRAMDGSSEVFAVDGVGAITGDQIKLSSGDGDGYGFWGSDNYEIYMRQDYATEHYTSDYNMYFTMAGGTNRGFVFTTGTTPTFQVDASGNMWTNGAARVAPPSDIWHTGGSFYLIGSESAPLGKLDTQGSYRVSLTSNGYRNGSDWVQFNANGNTGAASIDLAPDGHIFFGVEADKANGSSSFPTTAMTVDSNGRVGIGTTSPSADLHVDADDLGTSDGDEEEILRLHSDTVNQDTLRFFMDREGAGGGWETAVWKIQRLVDATNMGYMEFGDMGDDLITFGEGGTEYMRIDGSGEVGIGTASPVTNLHISDGSGNDPEIQLTSDYTGHTATDGFLINGNVENVYLWLYEEGQMQLATNNTARIKIDSAGRVGISTTDIEAWDTYDAMQLGDDNAIAFGEAGNYGLQIVLNAYYDGQWKYRTTDEAARISLDNGDIRLDYKASGTVDTALSGDWDNALFVENTNGYVGINQNVPTVELHVNPSAYFSDGDNGVMVCGENWQTGSNGCGDYGTDESYIVDDDGTYQALMLVGNDVSGDRRVEIYDDLDVNDDITNDPDTSVGSDDACFSGTGAGSKLGICSSSLKLKENVQDLELGLDLVRKMRPVSFDWKVDGRNDIGFISEELHEIEPRLVIYEDETGHPASVNYRHYTAALTKAIQELDERTSEVEQLRKELDELKAQVAALE